MIKSINFPRNTGQRYYMSHYRFVSQLAQGAGITVNMMRLDEDGRGFWFFCNGRKILVDIGDHKHIGENVDNYPIHFRFHYSDEKHSHLEKCRPLTPISFYDWSRFFYLEKQIEYKADRDFVLNNQRPGKVSTERRTKVQRILKKYYGKMADFEITLKPIFWKKVGTCLASICVPGARNDILDRGQFQYWAFGACTISPPLDITLPFWKRPTPGVHYISCRPDYSDLVEKIEFCKRNRQECVQIGRQAKKLFMETSTPKKVWEWIDISMKELGL